MRPDRVQMDVMADPPKSFARIYQPAFVTPLKDMAALVAVAVEAVGKRPLQPVHAIDEVGVRRRESHMVVVRHHDPGVNDPVSPAAGLGQTLQERGLGPIQPENRGAIVAPIQDVVCASLGFHSHWPRHAFTSPAARGHRGLQPVIFASSSAPLHTTWPDPFLRPPLLGRLRISRTHILVGL